MKNHDYVPPGDEQFDTFQGIIYSHIVAHAPGTAKPWGYGQERIDVLTLKKERWDDAWLVAKDENKRNRGDVVEKDEARADLEADLRDFVAEWLRANSLITDEERQLMGLTIADKENTDRPQIETLPLERIKPLGGGRMDFSFRMDKDQTRPSMHPDADVIEVRIKLGGAAPQKPEDCPLGEESTKAHFTLDFGMDEAGSKIHVFARWKNQVDKTKSGPWAGPFSSRIV